MKKNLLFFVYSFAVFSGIVAQDTLRITQKNAILEKSDYTVSVLIIDDNVTIDIRNHESLNIRTGSSFIGNNVTFYGKGKDGENRPKAPDGANAGECQDAGTYPEQNGVRGGDGEKGVNLMLDLGRIERLGSLAIDVSGGKGGKGGDGGNGGRGGRADCNRCSGKQGGNGGKGGDGGNGGDGGMVEIKYCNTLGIQPIFNRQQQNSIQINNRGGDRGIIGQGGGGGAGGEGRECEINIDIGIFKTKVETIRRSPGIDGQPGAPGNTGALGRSREPNIQVYDCRALAPAKRIALVLANGQKYNARSDYFKPLDCPEHDFTNMLEKLRSLGFSDNNIVKGQNLKKQELLNKLLEFQDLIRKNPNSSAVIYYAGHGFESEGRNYFVPIDADSKIKRKRRTNGDEIFKQIKNNSIPLADLFSIIEENAGGLNIVLLDACRTNNDGNMPFKSSYTINQVLRETWVYYPNAKGNVTSCNPGDKSSKFTSVLLRQMSSNMDFDGFVRECNRELIKMGQNPELRGNSTKVFKFNQ